MNVNITFCEESEICTVRNEYNNDTSIVHVLYDPLDINYFVIKLVILGQGADFTYTNFSGGGGLHFTYTNFSGGRGFAFHLHTLSGAILKQN